MARYKLGVDAKRMVSMADRGGFITLMTMLLARNVGLVLHYHVTMTNWAAYNHPYGSIANGTQIHCLPSFVANKLRAEGHYSAAGRCERSRTGCDSAVAAAIELKKARGTGSYLLKITVYSGRMDEYKRILLLRTVMTLSS